jgi:hypothetical protein
VKLLRTIRLDPSDTFIFPNAAEPGEWAVSGAFVFADTELDALEGRDRAAFRAGFLGVGSFGWSTLVQIVETDAAGHEAAIALLAQGLSERFGAPDHAVARAAAQEEIAFAASLCNHPAGTLIAMHRTEEDGAIHEAFRSLRPAAGPKTGRVFDFVEVEGEEEPGETVDLAALARGETA